MELLQWFVSPGDTVSQFDRICEVQSDKASVEITSRFDGVVESLCGKVGDMMSVGKPLLYITTAGGGDSGGEGSDAAQKNKMIQQTTLHNVDDQEDRLHIPSVGANYSSYYPKESDGDAKNIHREWRSNASKVLSSPAVRKLCKDHKINLETVLGTGPEGRVLKADVLKIIKLTDNALKTSFTFSSTENEARSNFISSKTELGNARQEDMTVPIRGYNRLMVKSMTASLQVPHMVYADEINVNALHAVRDSLRPLAKERGVIKLTYLPFFLKAASLALNEYPVLNSTIDVHALTMTYHKDHNIGVAVDTDRGLAVPVVKGCQNMSVLEIAEELGRLHSLVSYNVFASLSQNITLFTSLTLFPMHNVHIFCCDIFLAQFCIRPWTEIFPNLT